MSNLTNINRRTLAHALMCAINAQQDLGLKAAPTVETLNRTMERLGSIQALLEQVLA